MPISSRDPPSSIRLKRASQYLHRVLGEILARLSDRQSARPRDMWVTRGSSHCRVPGLGTALCTEYGGFAKVSS
jgi:hypothetical protein